MSSGCPMMMFTKTILISSIAAFVALFGVEYLVHGVWLKPIYEQTASMWRPKEEMGMFPWCVIRLAVLSVLISALYCKCKKAKLESGAESGACATEGKKECPMKRAMCFGTLLGLLMGTWMASCYLWMPIPGELAVDWFIGGFVEGLVVSMVIACVSCDKMGSCTMKNASPCTMKEEDKA